MADAAPAPSAASGSASPAPSAKKEQSQEPAKDKKEKAPKGEPAGPQREFDLGFPVHALAHVGEYLIAAGGGGEAKTGISNALVVFKWQGSKLVKALTHNTGALTIQQLAAHPREQVVAYVGLEGEGGVLSFGERGVEARPGREAGPGITEGLRLLAFSRQGDELLALDSQGRARLLAFPSIKVRQQWDTEQAEGVSDAAFDPAGELLATTSERGVRLWAPRAPDASRLVGRLDEPPVPGALFRHARFGPGGRLYVGLIRKPVGGRSPSRQPGRSWLAEYALGSGPARGRLTLVRSLEALPAHYTALALADDGRFAALGTDEGGLCVVRLDYFSVASRLRPHEWVVTAAAFSPSGKAVASASVAHTLKVAKTFQQHRSYLNMLWALLALILIFYLFAVYIRPFGDNLLLQLKR